MAEIRARGYRGSLRTLREYLAGIRRQRDKAPPPPPVPSTRQLTAWIMRPDEKLDEADRLGLTTACAACSEVAALTELAHGFNELVRTRGGARLKEWIKRAIASPFAEVRGFAKGLYGDFDAVKAGLTLEWSSGKVEGNVTYVKMINDRCTAARSSTCSASGSLLHRRDWPEAITKLVPEPRFGRR